MGDSTLRNFPEDSDLELQEALTTGMSREDVARLAATWVPAQVAVALAEPNNLEGERRRQARLSMVETVLTRLQEGGRLKTLGWSELRDVPSDATHDREAYKVVKFSQQMPTRTADLGAKTGVAVREFMLATGVIFETVDYDRGGAREFILVLNGHLPESYKRVTAGRS
ncbi:MAG: hypothetical protein WC924_02750 [Candidatus Gracilibacteria bacterium]